MTFPRMNCSRLSTFAALAILTAVPALAQSGDDHGQAVILDAESELAAEPAGVISGVVGADLYSHFVSYGLDVWAEGEPFTGSETFNPYAEIGMSLGAIRRRDRHLGRCQRQRLLAFWVTKSRKSMSTAV